MPNAGAARIPPLSVGRYFGRRNWRRGQKRLAIACGIVAGKKLGESARAALTSRGFAEMQRLGLALGAKAETLAGLSGLGDLVDMRERHIAQFSLVLRWAKVGAPKTY